MFKKKICRLQIEINLNCFNISKCTHIHTHIKLKQKNYNERNHFIKKIDKFIYRSPSVFRNAL